MPGEHVPVGYAYPILDAQHAHPPVGDLTQGLHPAASPASGGRMHTSATVVAFCWPNELLQAAFWADFTAKLSMKPLFWADFMKRLVLDGRFSAVDISFSSQGLTSHLDKHR